jgi:nucleoside-diphosphate-sugar epimerase
LNTLFCFGLGYTALRLGLPLKTAGWSLRGTCQSADQRAHLAEQGIDAHIFDAGRGGVTPSMLEGATHLLLSAPPGEDGDPVLNHLGDAIAALPALEWVGYLSATSVYGDSGGKWVNEETHTSPTTERGLRRADAEVVWRRLWKERGVPVHIFRLAGIYGPGRSAFDQLRKGAARRIRKPGHLFSRIHVDDICAVLKASMAKPDPGAIYNVCDDEAAESSAVMAFAAGLLDMPPPEEIPFDDASLSPMARSFYADSRLVSNARIKRDLGIALQYPDYRVGLRAVLEEETA